MGVEGFCEIGIPTLVGFSIVSSMEITKTFQSLLLFFCVSLSPLSQPFTTTTLGNTTDGLALLSFKKFISHDPYNFLSSWNNSLHLCRWRGITCSRRHRYRVVSLDLQSVNFVGSISPAIGNLTFLRRIDLSSNRLCGTIPSEVGRLFRLRYLNLSYNLLDGPISSSLTGCQNLLHLDFAENKLVGNIPTDIGSLSKLISLKLATNNLTGVIPPSLGNLSSLTMLELSQNKLTNGIPSSLGNLFSLIFLRLSQNSLTGSFPIALWKLSKLEILDLSFNNLNGAIPLSVRNLSSLILLDLSNNSLTGSIPPLLGSLSSLDVLDLSINQLTGSIPPLLGRLTTLKYLILSDNHLKGVIPPSLTNLTSLEVLDLFNNELDGSLPEELGNLKSIIDLLMGYNRLSGPIPASLYNLSSLEYLNLMKNQVSGTLSTSIGDMNIEILHMNGNQLEGPIPTSLFSAYKLRHVDLGDNRFTGRVPNSIGKLRNLYRLFLEGNMLEAKESGDWDFITSLTNCSLLENLDLSDNNLGGVLPDSIGNLSTKIKMLTMGRNQVSGNIPEGIGNLVNLTLLSLEQNDFTGSIPVSIGKLQKLQVLGLNVNRFSGHIPSSLGNLSLLNELHLNRNTLQGSIPASLGNCQDLTVLDLSRNHLSGSIPQEVVSISSLSRFLDLSHNLLNGSLPMEVDRLRNLGVLDLAVNKLSGEIPSTLRACQHLEYLYLDNNAFQGTIPSTLSDLKGLQAIDLSRNNLSGHFPEFLVTLRSLVYVNLSFNNLEGEVPTKGIFENASAISILGNNRLCGGITMLKLPACPNQNSEKRSAPLKTIFAIVGGVLSFLILCSVVVCFLKRRWKNIPMATTSTGDQFRRISYTELLEATDGFSSTNLIGMGSSGTVYKGIVTASEDIVAVKVLKLQQKRASKLFVTECEALRNIRHRNLVKVVTTCSSLDYRGNDFKAIVFEYMSNGSLETWLHPKASDSHPSRRKLQLHQKLSIAIDVASALDYLHNNCETPIIHCDLKPSNVLLDNDMTAKVGDFGLARFILKQIKESSQNPSISTAIKGSVGYIAPEYGMGGQASTCGDVYSYGILTLELFTGKSPTDEIFKDGLTLHKFTEMTLSQASMVSDMSVLVLEDEDVVDDIQGHNHMRDAIQQCLASVMKIGLSCSKEQPRDRMEIKEVVTQMHIIRDTFQRAQLH